MPKRRGVKAERHYRTHLTWPEVRQIRALRTDEKATYVAIGEKFNISPDTARDICLHYTWRDDPEAPVIPLASSYGHRT